MRASRTTQPFRRGARAPGAALTAMTKGRTAGGLNPADVTRATQRMKKAGKARRRPKRPARPARPPR